MIHFNDFFECMATFCSIKCGEYKIFDYTFIMNTQVDIKKNLLRYLSQKCSQCFDMLKREIFGLLGGPPCNVFLLQAQC